MSADSGRTTIDTTNPRHRWRYVCPRGHKTWEPTNCHFWCPRCARAWDADGDFDELVDQRDNRTLQREEVRLDGR